MTEERKEEWIETVLPHLPDYYLSETIGMVRDYLQCPMIGARYGAYEQEYSEQIADRIREIRNDLKALQDEIIKEEKADWKSLTGEESPFFK